MLNQIAEHQFDQRAHTCRFAGKAIPVANLSEHDRQQILCEQMQLLSAMAQLADGNQMLTKWESSEGLADDPTAEVRRALCDGNVWDGAAYAGADSDGVLSVLPTRYDTAKWTWSDGHSKFFLVKDMSKSDLGEAICYCLTLIAKQREYLSALASLIVAQENGFLAHNPN